ncbi:uncharacterized protein LOC131851585, partial [Achroia grisella]|uniref:uncharacterized protein LOC131851585 n=1 Tax=Achroia grisella TaxID=688607 RepID=UPI0027D29504
STTTGEREVSSESEVAPVIVAHAHGSSAIPCETPPSRSLLKVLPVTVTGPKGEMDIYALLDDGSTVTLIDQIVADTIGAQGPKGTIQVNCVGGLAKDSVVTYIDINIKGKHSVETFNLKRVRSIPNLGVACQTIRTVDVAKFSHLQDLVKELSYEEAKPLLIIGIDNWHLSLPHGIRRGSRNQPVAVQTVLGWTMFGRLPGKSAEFIHHSSVSDLESLIKEHYHLDSIGITKKDFHSINDERALAILNETTQRLPSGRFETGLLWRPDIISIPNSYKLALSRFHSLERKFKKDQNYAEAYKQYINGMIEKDYAELCTNVPPLGNLWYLPHFGVYHPQKKKLRLVHDAAAKCSGVSLNSLLLPGPDLLQPLLGILMRFREGEVALNGDIREMFPQTKIRAQDRDAQRFLWRDDPSLPIAEYRMSSMIFGATSSPCTAIFLKNKNALEHQTKFPEAAEAIVRDHYMDDYLGSVDSPELAARLVADIVTVHKEACLEMCSWVSNNPKALTTISPDLWAADTSEVGLGPTSPSQVRILGVAWNIKEDTLNFRKSTELPTNVTKRVVLSHLMKVYDPLGFLMPLTIAGRILFQETWRMGIDWDEELPASAKAKWQTWFAGIAEVSAKIKIPRCYRTRFAAECQLHVLADSSESAYACVAFWRFVHQDQSVHLALIGGKARLAPLKPVSIPRLELQAALMASRFATYILEAHRLVASRVFFWTDSLTVLKWLRSDARTFKPFVAHRVGEILETTNVANWRYVPSALNVADDATRGLYSLSSSSRWYTGPDFLLSPPDEWPREPAVIAPLVIEELKPEHALTFLLTEHPEMPSPIVANHDHFGRWVRLVRATGRAHHCAKIFRSLLKKPPNSKLKSAASKVSFKVLKPLSAAEILEAERHLFLYTQLESFKHEFLRLTAGLPPTNQGRLRGLVLMLGEDGLIRLNGRIRAVLDAPAQDINPIVLDGRHPIIKLLLDHYHRKFGHGNIETVVNFLRGKFYIIALRPSVRSVAKQCSFCRIRKLLPSTPQFGDLPEDRLSHHQRAFSFCGLDYFGPVEVAVGRRREKRWVALFTCLTIRAVHLEIVGSLSADAAIMALRRFIARRGCPARIISDNGTAFVGAANQLTDVFDFAANHKIEWVFICPAAPSMGGAWERLVRSIKSALSVTLKEQAPREEVLSTLLLEAEAVVNSRPLTHVPVEPETLQALTPFHFLLGTPSTELVCPRTDADLCRRLDHRKVLRLAELFWARWLHEYLPTLIPRKAGSTQAKFKVGDPVLVADPNLPRGTWPKGRISKIFTGPDGVVRVVEIRGSMGILKRPVRKVLPLLLEQGTQENCAQSPL